VLFLSPDREAFLVVKGRKKKEEKKEEMRRLEHHVGGKWNGRAWTMVSECSLEQFRQGWRL
jgi:hypothetical protein